MKKIRELKNFLAVSIGNMLEWYDFQLSICLFNVISSKCLPPSIDVAHKNWIAIVMCLMGYSAQPLGAIIFSYIADTKGRVFALSRSVQLMGIAALIIGFVPTYETAGIFSPIIFILARILQGMSLGAESRQSYVYIMERYKEHKNKMLLSSFINTFTAFAFLASQLIGDYVNEIMITDTDTHIWRLPFLLGGLVGFVGIKMRSTLLETLDVRMNIVSKNQMTFFASTKIFLKSVIAFVKQNPIIVILYSMCWGSFYVVAMLNDYSERIIATEILEFEVKGYYVKYLEITILSLVAMFYKPKNKSQVISMILKGPIAAFVLMIISYYLLTNINIYRFYISLICIDISFALLWVNTVLVPAYLIPQNVRCSVVAFFASCVCAITQFTVLPTAIKLKIDYGIWEYIFIYPICLIFITILVIKRFQSKSLHENLLDDSQNTPLANEKQLSNF